MPFYLYLFTLFIFLPALALEARIPPKDSRKTDLVFLSFRGNNTRKGFTEHLYRALVQAGVRTFKDEYGIPKGENIVSEINKAIYESRIAVVVFSKDYASSKWCLNELVLIMERRRIGKIIVLPVFYDVDPSEVGEQTRRYGQAFAEYEKLFKDEMDTVEQWRKALTEAADLAGMVLGERYESEFIQDIVHEVKNKLQHTVPNVPPYSSWNRFFFIKLMEFILFTILLLGLIFKMGNYVCLRFSVADIGRKFTNLLMALVLFFYVYYYFNS